MPQDHLLQSIGYIKPDGSLKISIQLVKKMFTFLVTIPKSMMVKLPLSNPDNQIKSHMPRQHISLTYDMGIRYGPYASIGGFKHTVLFVGSSSRYKYVYPWNNLAHILPHMRSQVVLSRCFPSSFIPTSIKSWGDIGQYIEETQGVNIESSPPYDQHQNSVVAQAW